MTNSAEVNAEHLSVSDHATIVSAMIEHRGFVRDEVAFNFAAIGLNPPPRVILESLLRAPGIKREAADRVKAVISQLGNFELALEKARLTAPERTLLNSVSTALGSAPHNHGRVRALRSPAETYRKRLPKYGEAIDQAAGILDSGIGVIYEDAGAGSGSGMAVAVAVAWQWGWGGERLLRRSRGRGGSGRTDGRWPFWGARWRRSGRCCLCGFVNRRISTRSTGRRHLGFNKSGSQILTTALRRAESPSLAVVRVAHRGAPLTTMGHADGSVQQPGPSRRPGCSYSRKRRRSLDNPIDLGALAPWGDRRVGLAGVQGPQHGDLGHHNNAALLGRRDQTFHDNLPVLALGFGRRQRKDMNASIAYGSKFATVAGRNRIKKMAGPTCLPAERAWQITHRISKQRCRPQLAARG